LTLTLVSKPNTENLFNKEYICKQSRNISFVKEIFLIIFIKRHSQGFPQLCQIIT